MFWGWWGRPVSNLFYDIWAFSHHICPGSKFISCLDCSSASGKGGDLQAIVRASAVNQDGRSSSLTAPNGPSQKSLVQECLQTAVALPESIAYIAVHGTGTPLGDPIEVGALAGSLGKAEHGKLRAPVIGSVKVRFLDHTGRSKLLVALCLQAYVAWSNCTDTHYRRLKSNSTLYRRA